jgi:hypothetical protein
MGKKEEVIVINININRNTVYIGTILLLIIFGVVFFVLQPKSASAAQPLAVNAVGFRKYYLTTNLFDGASANGSDGYGAGVCARGYHFASLWEILDPSNLVYDPSLGFQLADSGSGPPSYTSGWVRTGGGDYTGEFVGLSNCDVWDSNDPSHFGSKVYLDGSWLSAQDIGVWHAEAVSCNLELYVWCVENLASQDVYVPLIRK